MLLATRSNDEVALIFPPLPPLVELLPPFDESEPVVDVAIDMLPPLPPFLAVCDPALPPSVLIFPVMEFCTVTDPPEPHELFGAQTMTGLAYIFVVVEFLMVIEPPEPAIPPMIGLFE